MLVGVEEMGVMGREEGMGLRLGEWVMWCRCDYDVFWNGCLG